MQGLPGEEIGVLPFKLRMSAAVKRIAEQGMPDARHVHADLVRAPGLKPDIEQRKAVKAFGNGIVRDGGAPVRDDRHLLAVARISADRAVDRAVRIPEIAAGDRLVFTVDAVLLQAVRKHRVRKVVFRHDEQSARVLVDAVHDAGAAFAADTGQPIAHAVKQGIDKRSAFVAGGGMHDHALRLVDDGKVVVLIDDLNGDVLGQRLGLAHGRERDADGIEIYRLPSWPVMGGRFPVLKPFADADDLWAQGIDFAVIQTRMYMQSVWAARQCKRRGIPALVIDHSTGYMLHGGLAGALGKAYEHAACGSIRRCGFPFYGVSGDVCRWLETFGIQAAGRLPNAVDPAELERLAHADNAVDWRRRLNVPADGRLVAFVGRLIPEKGALRLAQAVQGIPGCTLAVAGTGPEETALAALGGGIHALGALPHERIVQLLTQADAYCLPTEYAEGFPTTLLEAAACRCPIVTTRTAGTDELLPGDDYAVFLANAAPETIRAGLETLLADPAAARTRAENTRQNLCSHFTWQAVFATMMEAVTSAKRS